MYVKLDDFRTQSSQRSFPILIVLSGFMLLISAVIVASELVSYSDLYNNTNATFGDDVTIGGVQVGGLNEADRLQNLELVYVEQPVLLYYDGSPVLLMPPDVGFRLDTDAMQAAATNQIESDFWGGFWKHLWRSGSQAVDVPLSANFDPAELRRYLEDLALRYNTLSGSSSTYDAGTYVFRGSGSRTELDINAAMPLIERALFELDPEQRVVDLPLVYTEGQPPTMDALEEALLQYLASDGRIFYDGPESAVSIFVLDLQTGEEIGIFENLPHDATSTIKIGIIINYFRHSISEPPPDVRYSLANAVICSDNGSANTLMEASDSDGWFVAGIRNVNDTMCQAGAVNTKIISRLWIGQEGTGTIPVGYYTSVDVTPCPGATRIPADTSIATTPDPFNQATAADLGTMLMQIYDCAFYGSGLRTIFPEEITQTECLQMLQLLQGTHFIHMSELGVPEDVVTTAHKVGYADDTFGDAGIMFTPGGDYIFVMFVWERGGAGNGLTDINKWSMISDANRIVYNYFNPAQPLTQIRPPVNPQGGAACVMPLPGYEISLADINTNRFDERGIPISGVACYDAPDNCRPFDNWGRN